ncbi:MAG: ATP-binding protein [Lentisphaeraceae bacterium]|nr:ATP-binding protein [Lentisphaeraceae bacterium]
MNKGYINAFIGAAEHSLKDMFGSTYKQFSEVLVTTKPKIFHEIIVTVPFSGTINGSYYVTLDYETARLNLRRLIGDDSSRELLSSLLKELLNTIVGEAFNALLVDYPNLTFLAPSLYHAPADLPEIDTAFVLLKTDEHEGDIGLFFRLDTMAVQITDDLNKISSEKDKVDLLYGQLLMVNEQLNDQKEKSKALLAQAENASKMKAQFLAVMSHEMRTPLNAVIGFTDILLDESLTTEQRGMLSTVKRSGNSLLSIINDVLDLTKIEANAMEVESIPFNLEDIVYDAVEMAKAKLSDSSLELNVDMGDVYPITVGDPTKLRQILTNLAGNAVKFTNEGEVLVKVEIISEDENWQNLRFIVRDTGIGMTPEEQSKIFEPFKQADSSTTRKYGGTGLGLSISKGMVEVMGSQLSLASEKGKGTEFSFKLHMKKVKAVARKESQVSFRGLKALIMDDNQNATRILESLLIGNVSSSVING